MSEEKKEIVPESELRRILTDIIILTMQAEEKRSEKNKNGILKNRTFFKTFYPFKKGD